MQYGKLGSTGMDVSRICLGCMSYGIARARHARVDARRGGEPSVHQAGDRGRHQLLRHRQRVLRRHERGDRRAGPRRVRPPRRDRAGDQGARPDAAGPERRRALPQGDHDRDRRQPAPPRDRLRRPLPDPPLGSPDADRGDDGGVARRRQGRQGPLHRGVVDVRLAVLQGPVRRRGARLDAVRDDAEPLQPAVPGGGAGDAAAVRRPRRRRDPVEPAGAGPADP